jgi:hypothetical protein
MIVELAIKRAPKEVVARIAGKLNALGEKALGDADAHTWGTKVAKGVTTRPRVVMKDEKPHLVLYRGVSGGKKGLTEARPATSQPRGTPGSPSAGFSARDGTFATTTRKEIASAFARPRSKVEKIIGSIIPSRRGHVGTYLLPEEKLGGIQHINPLGEYEVKHADMAQHIARIRAIK